MVRIDETSTRADLLECLANLATHAKRQQCIVEKLTTDPPSAWSVAHLGINEALDALEKAPA